MRAVFVTNKSTIQPGPFLDGRCLEGGALEFGDDVYGEDPPVDRFETAAAARVGEQVAVFVPSGTMANQIAIRLHTHHAEVVLASHGAHVLRYEGGAASALAGVQIATIGAAGFFDAEAVRAASFRSRRRAAASAP